jgi:hypothetical protein
MIHIRKQPWGYRYFQHLLLEYWSNLLVRGLIALDNGFGGFAEQSKQPGRLRQASHETKVTGTMYCAADRTQIGTHLKLA